MMQMEQVEQGMNVYLELTKLHASSKDAELMCVIGQKGQAQQDFYKKLIASYSKAWKEVPSWYEQRLKLYYNALDSNRSKQFDITCKSPLVMGQGQASVLGTHLTIHRIYGVPYIPATALKGVSAHYCHQYLGADNHEFRIGGDYYNVLFGTNEQAALIHYYDGFPTIDTVGKALRLDVMTPHHQKYNAIEAVEAPRDDDSPVPIHFLTMSAKFHMLLTCDSVHEEDLTWLDVSEKIVTGALQQEGLGGKTNAGYGRF